MVSGSLCLDTFERTVVPRAVPVSKRRCKQSARCLAQCRDYGVRVPQKHHIRCSFLHNERLCCLSRLMCGCSLECLFALRLVGVEKPS